MREVGNPTVPSLLSEEKATNPFLRTSSPEIRNVRVEVAEGMALTLVLAVVKAAA